MKSFYKFIENNQESYSQIKQDLLVSYFYENIHPGFFVEIGAMDGIQLSNTFLLEKKYGWNGILVEPIPELYEKLKNNRSCFVENSCVYLETKKQIEFCQTDFLPLSTIKEYMNDDHWADARKNNKIYKVNAISLKDLLKKYNAPKTVDYLSIDTEGSEYDILKSFDFSTKFNIITCEHNDSYKRKLIFNLLIGNEYEKVFARISKWEDWYIHKSFKKFFYDIPINNIDK